MQFMVTYAFHPDDRDTVQQRFEEIGAEEHEGVTKLGRWHATAGHRGWVLVDTTDSVALGRWLQDWTDLMEFEVVSVNDDAGAMAILGT
jgi:hypothetical protein